MIEPKVIVSMDGRTRATLTAERFVYHRAPKEFPFVKEGPVTFMVGLGVGDERGNYRKPGRSWYYRDLDPQQSLGIKSQ